MPFLSASGMSPYNKIRVLGVVSEPPATGGLLFDYPGSNAAYSLRQLKTYAPSDFEQKVIRVKRSIGTPAEKDFTSTEITDGTLLAFTGTTGADNGFITRLYDQSGSGNHLIQNAAGNQGAIVSAGVLIQLEDTQGASKPAISMLANSYYDFTELITPRTTFSLLKTEIGSNLNYLIWNGTTNDAGLFLRGNFVNNKVGVYDGTLKEAFSANSGRQLTYYNYTGTTPSGNYEISQNDNPNTSLNAGKVVDGDELGRSFVALSINSIFQELVFYPTDNSANKTGIKTNLESYYSIFYNSQAQAIFNQMATNGSEPTDARKNIINQLVLDLKGIGNTGSDDVWSIFDVLQIYAAEDTVQAKTEWINANGTLDATEVNSPLFTTDVGYTGDTGKAIDTNYQPVTNATNYALNNASVGAYVVSGYTSYMTGIVETGDRYIWIRNDDDGTIDAALNSKFNQTGSFGLKENYLATITRSTNTQFKLWTNKTLSATKNQVSTAVPPTYSFYFLGMNRSTPTFSAAQGSIFFAGGDLSPYMDQVSDSLNAYITSL